MELTFHHEYKSIKRLPIEQLPNFSVITGANGAGKTHLLLALNTGALVAADVKPDGIRYYTWNNLSIPDTAPVQPRQLEDNRNNAAQHIYAICAAFKVAVTAKFLTGEQAIQNINHYLSHSRLHHHVNFNIQTNNIGQNINYQIDKNQAFVFQQIILKISKPFYQLNREECFDLYPLVADEQDPFVGSLSGLFAAYVQVRANNAMKKALATEYGGVAPYLTATEFLTAYGLPPWQVFNKVLESANLSFRFEEPNPDPAIPLEIKLRHIIANVEVKFADLSSGERVLISLANFLFSSQDPRQPTAMPDLILLDEVDAPLHPSMTVALLNTIEKVMVKEYGRKVVLATHSPSTVALAPEESIHVLDVATKTLRKATRDEGVQALTVGVPILSINLANRRQAFVESQYDVALYERIAAVAKPHLLPNVSLNFMAAGHEKNGGCALVISLVNQLNTAGNNTVFGIVDWDGNRSSKGNVLVLGAGIRHSIENYLFDPILLGALLLREKAVTLATTPPLLQDRENYFHLRDFDNSRLQKVADAVAVALGFPLADLMPINYANGRTVQVPQAYLHLRGHDLESKIKTTFFELKRFHQEPKLKEEILHKILEDMPELLPSDFIEMLASIQGSAS